MRTQARRSARKTLALLLLTTACTLTSHAQKTKVLFYGPTFNTNTAAAQLLTVSTNEFEQINSGSAVWTPGDSVSSNNWSLKTTAQFQAFDVIVIGDLGTTQITNPIPWKGALTNVNTWSAAVSGNVLLFGGDPEVHAGPEGFGGNANLPGAKELIHQSIRFAAADTNAGPGLYIAFAAVHPDTGSPVDPNQTAIQHLLSGLGDFTLLHGHFNHVQKIYQHPFFANISDEDDLSVWNDSSHTGFTSWPSGFYPIALVTDAPPTTRTPSALLPAGGVQGLVHILAKSPSNSLKRFSLAPANAGRLIGSTHTVTATFLNQDGTAPTNLVKFEIQAGGANYPRTHTNTTVNGTVSWVYTDGSNGGADTIVATVTNQGTVYKTSAEVTWADNVVSVTNSIPTADEDGLQQGQFKISRTGDLQFGLTVNLEFPIPPGTAIRGSDYLADPDFDTVLTFDAYEDEILINITPVQDRRVEDTESVVLTILPHTDYAVGTASATVNILDNEEAVPIPISYTVQALGIPSYATSWDSSAYHLNNNTVPRIAGDFRPNPNTYYYQHAFLGHNGSVTDLLYYYPTLSAYGYGINDSNTVVGRTDYGNAGMFRPARWTNGVLTILGSLRATGLADSAVAINNSGTIVGSCINTVGKMHAVRWAANSTLADDLDSLDLSPDSISYAYSINNAGRVAGKSQLGGTAFHAFLTQSNDDIFPEDDLGTMDNGDGSSEATGVNDFDEVVGASDTSSGLYRAFYKVPNTPANSGFVDLGTLVGGNRSLALGINNVGHIVGTSRTTSSGGNRAFIYYNGGSKMENLTLKLSNGSGWTLFSAEEINDAGFIVGWGYYNGYRTAFILSPNFQ